MSINKPWTAKPRWTCNDCKQESSSQEWDIGESVGDDGYENVVYMCPRCETGMLDPRKDELFIRADSTERWEQDRLAVEGMVDLVSIYKTKAKYGGHVESELCWCHPEMEQGVQGGVIVLKFTHNEVYNN